MKTLLLIGMLLSTTPVFASESPTCPNFTGTYKWIGQIASVYMSIYQTSCDAVDVFYDYGGGTTAMHQLFFDGKKHTIFDNPALLSVETYSWVDGKMMIKGVDHWFKEGKTITNTEVIYFEATGQVVDETSAVNQNGETISSGSMTYKKMAGLTAANMAAPFYLGLVGRAKGVSQDQLFDEIHSRFTVPLDAMKGDVKATYNFTVDAGANLNFGLIVESLTPQGAAGLSEYVKGLDQTDFHGLSVRFQNVKAISETVRLVAGVHQDGSGNEFVPNSETPKTFTLHSLSAWVKFTDQIGNAFHSRNSREFQDYLTWFLGGTDQFLSFATRVLSRDDVVMAELDPTLILDDETTVKPDSSVSPFLDFAFARDCWQAGYEHGKCYSADSR